MCEIKKCGCNIPNSPIICMSYKENPNCEDRSLTVSNTTDPLGYSGVTMITPEVNQISAYTEHLEFVNSPEPLSGIKKHTVLRIAQSFIDGITGLISNFVGKNLGTGSKIYKGPKREGENVIQEFRTLKNSESVEFQEGTDDIIAVVNEEWLQQQFPAIPTINYPVIDGKSSSNYGTPVYDGLDADKKIKILPVSSGQINIQKKTTPEGQDYLDFDIPVSADETIKQFYVNTNYTGGGASFEGNGSILKPYKKLTYALRDIIGNGYACAPQFPDSVINLLSDVTVLQSDLDAVPRLNNRLSVQSTIISSSGETRYSIVYDGSSDYPFDTKSLCEEALTVFGGGVSGASLKFQIKVGFNNVELITTKTTGIIRSWSYDGHNKFDGTEYSSQMTLNDVLFKTSYNTENYSVYKKLTDYQGNNISLYGSDIYGQDTENNLPPHMLVYGLGNVKEGQHNIKNLYASGLSATMIKIERTTVNFGGNTTIVQNSHRMPVQSLNPSNPGEYLPKNDITIIEMDSSWVRFEKLDHKVTYPMIKINKGGNIVDKLLGGYNSFFSVKKTHSISPHCTIQTGGGQFLSGILNYFITIDTTNANPSLIMTGLDYGSMTTEKGFCTRTAGTFKPTVIVSGSKFNNVKSDTQSNVFVFADTAIINGYQFIPGGAFPSDDSAKGAGLIVGNVYYNTTSNSMKKITS